MQLAFHGATTIKANLESDIRNSQQAGIRRSRFGLRSLMSTSSGILLLI
jgi:hypothetical protein